MIGAGAIILGALVFVICRGPGAVIKAFSGLLMFLIILGVVGGIIGTVAYVQYNSPEAKAQREQESIKSQEYFDRKQAESAAKQQREDEQLRRDSYYGHRNPEFYKHYHPDANWNPVAN